MNWYKIIAVAGLSLIALKYISENNHEVENYDEVVTEETTEDYSTNTLKTLSEYKPEPLSNGSNANSSVHTDSRYKYEYRTGSSGDYQYNYDVSGSDYNGNGVYGNVDMQGQYGSGTITDDDGNEKYIDVEWTGYGTLEATDEDGNSYDLEAE